MHSTRMQLIATEVAWLCVCLSLCLSVCLSYDSTLANSEKTTESIETLFGGRTRAGPKNYVLDNGGAH